MAKTPQRLNRADSFFGIHFDFHASDDCTQIGNNFTPKMIETVIKTVRPDYIQCDCKGHRGLSSYPTRVGNPAPGFIKDPLKIWRTVTAKHGVTLIMHYSGVWDTEALKKHPEWARVDEKDALDPNNTSVFKSYVDDFLIPQLSELGNEYHVDGAWVDGECWATCQDYAPEVIEAFRKQTGIQDIPRKPEDPHFFEFTEFCREGFRRYLRHYIETMKKRAPHMQITSNWAFSSHMPEAVSVDLPFLSGDYTLNDSLNAARLESRCLANQGKPWDLMAWSFTGLWEDKCRTTKSAEQLQQEASIVLAHGGGFQAYFTQNRDASIKLWQMPIMAEVAKFCRARQKICHRSQGVPQVGVHYSSAAYYHQSPRIFAPWNGILLPMRGVLQALLDGQASVDVLMDHHMRESMDQYPVLVLPEWSLITDELRERYRAYVRAGGNLLIVGPHAAKMFEKELGVTLGGSVEKKDRWIDWNNRLAGVASEGCDVTMIAPGTRVLSRWWPADDRLGESGVAATIRRYGKGKIAGIYLNLGARYIAARTVGTREMLQDMLKLLQPQPLVQVTGSHQVEVVPRCQRGKLCVHLINLAGPHADLRVYGFDKVPPIGPLQVAIRLPARPKRIVRQPQNKRVAFRWQGGVATLTLPSLHIHDVLVVE